MRFETILDSLKTHKTHRPFENLGYLYFRVSLTNRQHYKELLLLWYGSNYYPASIAPPWGFNLMGEINNVITLRCLQHIRNLELTATVLLPGTLSLSSPNMLPSAVYYKSIGNSNHQRSRQRAKGLDIHDLFLKECFRSVTQLRRLVLRVDLSRIKFDSYVGRSGKLRRDLV
jgi:hypothetical protein